MVAYVDNKTQWGMLLQKNTKIVNNVVVLGELTQHRFNCNHLLSNNGTRAVTTTQL